ncbi:MAG: 2-oxoacid:acceptor oxidoreductase family protein [Candidatus Diapherotrites archaeon]
MLEEIRFHGRAGQGVVTAAKALAISAAFEGLHSQAFPLFGSEKRGPPVVSFCRISDIQIQFIEEIDSPSIVVVTDPSVMDEIKVDKGLKENGLILINSKHPPKHFKFRKTKNVFTVDGTSLALKHLKKPITNTVMLGALAKITCFVSINSLRKGINIKLNKFPKEVIKANIDLVEESYKKTEAVK